MFAKKNGKEVQQFLNYVIRLTGWLKKFGRNPKCDRD